MANSTMSKSRKSNDLLNNAFGYMYTVLMVLASAAPIVVVAAYIPMSIAYGGGYATALTYAATTLILVIFAIGYVEMAKRITSTGAFYTFITQGLGKSAGLASGFTIMIGYSIITAAILGGFGFFTKELFAQYFNINLAWYVYSLTGLLIIFLISYFRITLTAKILGIALLLEVIIVLIVNFAILGKGGAEGILISAFNPVEWSYAPAIGVGFFLAFWSYIGFESTAIYSEETIDPKKSVPKATYISVITLGVFYTFTAFMAVSGFGSMAQETAAASIDNYFFDLASIYTIPFIRTMMDFLAVTGFFACAFADHNIASRYFYTFGRDGLIFEFLGKTHPKYKSPYLASLFQMVIAAIIIIAFATAGSDPLLHLGTWIPIIGTLCVLSVQFFVSLAVIAYFQRVGRKTKGDYVRTLIAPIIAAIAQVIVVILLINNITFLAESDSVIVKMIPLYVFLLYVTGFLYALYLKKNDKTKYSVIGNYK